MGTTADFIKMRSSGTPKVGVWNSNYSKALALAKKEGKFIVTCWSNGDKCGYCVTAEKCMMQSAFTEFMKSSDAYFVFQYSGDKDQGKALHDWIFTKGGVKQYPGFRVTLYDTKGNVVFDKAVSGNTLRSSKTGATGAKNMVTALKKMFAEKKVEPTPAPTPTPPAPYVVRLNEKLTTAQINKVLDALEKNGGYCPCQPKGDGTQCHCQDFVNNKKIGEPCICKIFVKQAPLAVRRVCDVARKCVAKASKTYVGESVGIRTTKKKTSKKTNSDTSCGVIMKVVDCSKYLPNNPLPFTLSASARGPIIAKSPEEIDDFMGEPRGTTREFMRKIGLCCVTAVKPKEKNS